MNERHQTGPGDSVEAPKEGPRGPSEEHPLSLDEVRSDWLTVAQFAAWSALSRNAAYEILRQEPYRQAVRRFGRQIRVSKKALARIVESGS